MLHSVPPPAESHAATPTEHEWLDRAVTLAADNVVAGGGPFAALVYREGEVIGYGVTRVTRDLDPTAHAEIIAIRHACRQVRNLQLTGCVLVASCEPCPMCLNAALWAHVERVVYAADRHDAAEAGFDDRSRYELFDPVRSGWHVPVQRLPVDDPTRPFQAWRETPQTEINWLTGNLP